MKKHDDVVVDCLLNAAQKSFSDLFKNIDERFYYCTLVMQELSVPYISAISYEALERMLQNNTKEYSLYKWSYADSPYCGYGYDKYFANVERLFEMRFNGLNEEETNREYEIWLSSMEEVMRILDSISMFGSGDKRNEIFINAEIMPPEESNFTRGRHLNPPSVYEKWKDDWEQTDEPNEIDWNEIWHPTLCDVIVKYAINDKKTVLRIKKAFNLNVRIILLIEKCQNAPCVIISSEEYRIVEKAMNNLTDLNDILAIKKY